MADPHDAGDPSGRQTAGLVELLNPPGGRAAGLCQATRLARAEAAYRGALERDSGNVAALHGLGLLCLQTRRNDEALALLRRASDAAVGPHAARVQAGLAAALGRLGRHAEAAAAGAEAVRLGPDDAGAWNNLGAALEHNVYSTQDSAVAAANGRIMVNATKKFGTIAPPMPAPATLAPAPASPAPVSPLAFMWDLFWRWGENSPD